MAYEDVLFRTTSDGFPQFPSLCQRDRSSKGGKGLISGAICSRKIVPGFACGAPTRSSKTYAMLPKHYPPRYRLLSKAMWSLRLFVRTTKEYARSHAKALARGGSLRIQTEGWNKAFMARLIIININSRSSCVDMSQTHEKRRQGCIRCGGSARRDISAGLAKGITTEMQYSVENTVLR